MRVNFNRFTGKDNLERFAAAMAYLREHPGSELFLPSGVYEITGEREREFYYDVIAGKYGANPQPYMLNRDFRYTRALDFNGQTGTVISGDGATLVFDGFFEPLSLRFCKDVTVRGVTVDYKRKPYSKGKILACAADGEGKGEITVEFREELPDTFCALRHIVYDCRTGRSEFAPLSLGEHRRISGNTFCFRAENVRKDYTGCELYVWHFFHSRPAVCIQNAERIRLENVTVHAHPGMGVVAHLSRDIVIDGLSVTPSAGDRVSTNTDATHFASCYGELTMRNCVFEGQGDDGVNVHTYYHEITPLRDRRYRLRFLAKDGTHTAAVDVPFVGDKLRLYRRGTLEEGAEEYTVLSAKENEEGSADVELDREIEFPPEEYYCANVSACPEFTLSHCRARNHFARSVLIKTKRAVVEHCIFEYSALTAVVIAAEEDWLEGIAAERVAVRGNVFVDCSACGRTASAVAVYTGSAMGTGIQHGEIIIEGNTVVCLEGLEAFSVRNTARPIVRDNTVQKSFTEK